MKTSNKSQIAFEYIVIVSLVIAGLLAGFYIFQGFAGESSEKLAIAKLGEISRNIAGQADKLSYYGPPSSSLIDVDFPDKIEDMYIVSVPENNEYLLVFEIQSSDGTKKIASDYKYPLFAAEERQCTKQACQEQNIECKCFPESSFSMGKKNILIKASYNCNGTNMTAEYIEPTESEPIDMVIVIDKSGSMYNNYIDTGNSITRISLVKDAAKRFVDSENWIELDTVGLISYYESVTVESQRKKMAFSHKEFLKNKITNLGQGPFTATGEAIYSAIDMLQTSNSSRKFILLMTDGYTNKGRSSIDAAKSAKSVGIKIFTIALQGADLNEIKSIAQESSGEWFNVNTKEDIQTIFSEIERSVFNPGMLIFPPAEKKNYCILIDVA